MGQTRQGNALTLCVTIRMAAPAKKEPPTQIQVRGEDLRCFVVHSALLDLIDPVRGEATRTPLDENPDGDTSGGQRLKQKFLDAFALLCSTSSKGAETASAVCLEQNVPAGAILRVARNHGLSPKDRAGLEMVLQVLQAIARKGNTFPYISRRLADASWGALRRKIMVTS